MRGRAAELALRRGRACPCLRLGAIEIASRRVVQLLYTSSRSCASRASRQSPHAEYEASVESTEQKRAREDSWPDPPWPGSLEWKTWR